MFEATGGVGNAFVVTTNNRAMGPDEIAELALNRIISVSEKTPMPLREQALAYKDNIREVLRHYRTVAAQADRRTIAASLHKEGHSALANKIADLD